MASNITTNNVGEVWDAITMTLLQRLDVLDTDKGGGLIGLHKGFNTNLYLPNFDLSGDKVIPFSAESVPTIVTGQGGSATDGDWTERTLGTTDLTFPIGNIIPNEWRAVWQEFAPNVNTPFKELMLNDAIRNAFIMRLVQYRGEFDSYTVWQGDTVTTGATYDAYDGIIKRVVDGAGASGTQDLTTSGATTFSASNIIGYLKTVYDGLLARPALKSAQGLKIIMSHEAMGFYEDAQVAISGKGRTDSDFGGVDNFRNIPIVTSNGFPNDFILCTYTNVNPLQSTLHMGMRNVQDAEDVEFAPYSDGARKWYFRLDYSMGTQITNLKDILFFDTRA